eukprot:SM000109S14149  [mRNA]  locus=s109:214433:222842:- [translate_table: standard]
MAAPAPAPAERGTSRLDRLFTLLDAGSTAAVRRMAAQQIGALAESRSTLLLLLHRVRPYLESKTWDTRVAAAQAVGCIGKNTPHPTVQDLIAAAQAERPPPSRSAATDILNAPEPGPSGSAFDSSYLTLSCFDVQQVLETGAPLLASGGQEYDIVLGTGDAAANLVNQKRNLRRRLGLDGAERFLDVSEMVQDDDLVAQMNVNEEREVGASKQGVHELVEGMLPRAVSAREQNLLKRKAKALAKEGWTQPSATSRRSTSGPLQPVQQQIQQEQMPRVGSEDGVTDEKLPDEGHWPFESFCGKLLISMFSPYWEVRHGSCMALRELLATQAASAAVVVPIFVLPLLAAASKREEASKRREGLGLLKPDLLLPATVSLPGTKSKLDPTDKQAAEKVNSSGLSNLQLPPGQQQAEKAFPVKPDVQAEMLQTTSKKFPDVAPEVVEAKEELGEADLLAASAVYQAKAANVAFLQDAIVRVLCILSLDRFGDYVGDQVVAPVRETGSQVLGTLVRHLPEDLLHETLTILLILQARPEWEVRHGGLLGIKYVIAVRLEAVAQALPRVQEACVAGLSDADDDVRAVAADALLPCAPTLAAQKALGLQFLRRLWEVLHGLDDLSPSTASVMALLAEIYTQPGVLQHLEKQEGGLEELSILTPRLFPFFSHTLQSVRLAATQTLERLLAASSAVDGGLLWVGPIAGEALGHVFRTLLLESCEPVVHASESAWRWLLQAPAASIVAAASTYAAAWMRRAASVVGTDSDLTALQSGPAIKQLVPTLAVNFGANRVQANRKRDKQSFEVPFGGNNGEVAVAGMRVRVARALGLLGATLPEPHAPVLVEQLEALLSSPYGVHRQVLCSRPASRPVQPPPSEALRILTLVTFLQVAGLVTEEWFREAREVVAGQLHSFTLQIMPLLAASNAAQPSPGSTAPYAELAQAYEKLQVEAQALAVHAGSAGVEVPQVPDAATMEDVQALVERIKRTTSASAAMQAVESRRQHLLATMAQLEISQQTLHINVQATLAGVLALSGQLPTKLNPVLQPLMAAIKRQQDGELQARAATALAAVVVHCCNRQPSPNDKLIRNLCVLATTAAENGEGQDGKEVRAAEAGSRLKAQGSVSQRGAEAALRALAAQLPGSQLLEKLPRLWDIVTEAVPAATLPTDQQSGHVRWQDIQLSQELRAKTAAGLLQCLRLASILAKVVAQVGNQELHARLLQLLPAIAASLGHSEPMVRTAAAKAIAAMALPRDEEVLVAVVELVLPMLSEENECCALGAIQCVHEVVEMLGATLAAWAGALVVAILPAMAHSSPALRAAAMQPFAQLVPLLPLARGLPSPARLPKWASHDVSFLEQLLDNRSIADFQLPMPLRASLRRYQQEGVNWLAFLCRFGLHGILCDDMGLGKTLQAIAMIAAESHQSELPSLVVCPATLVGHWASEVEQFVSKCALQALQFSGPPAARLELRDQVGPRMLLVISYETLRADVAWLETCSFEYCCLDEGHVIKSASSKIASAAKRLHARHRLVLTGTPIQNNVLELWSLFDFLMPGFLGSERQFQALYGRPIIAARDAKCSPREAEAGALAMEALHRQVMPFMLRRTKEQVLSDLPPKIVTDRLCDLSPLQTRLYDLFERSSEAANLLSAPHEDSCPATSPANVLQALQYLRKLCSHPILVLEDMDPQRREGLLSDAAETAESLHDLRHAPKLEALREILEECGVGSASELGDRNTSLHRVLIFVQLKASTLSILAVHLKLYEAALLDIVERDLFQAHMPEVTYLRLDGSVEVSKRFDIVKAFNSDPTIDVLLLTTHVGGLGLNLTSADTVIFLEHDWNPARDVQAMDRAHRLGQKRVVNVHRLLMRNTLEERIMGLQRFKLAVAATVVNSSNASLSSMDTTHLLDIFSGQAVDEATPALPMASRDAKGAGDGLKAVLGSLEELWDESQYTEEYTLTNFISRLVQ